MAIDEETPMEYAETAENLENECCFSILQENNGGVVKRVLVQSEYLLLKDFYDKTNGPHWTNNQNWNFSNPINNPCNEMWYGISFAVSPLNQSLCHISTISMFHNNLTGSLPDPISLPSLLYFQLSQNRLHGKLPRFRTPLLLSLDVRDNSFSGSLSSDMFIEGETRDLYEIELTNNLLTGTLPHWIYSFRSLRNLNIADNHLSGSLSSSDVSRLGILRSLIIQNNQFHGSMLFAFQLPKIRRFNADNNFFSGTLPAKIFTGQNTVPIEFTASGNNLEGPFPVEFQEDIESFFLSSNYFTGTLSSSLCSQRYLNFFGVSDNQLRGTIPSCYWTSEALILEFDYNLFHGPIHINMSAILSRPSRNPTPLSFVSFGFNHLSGTFPAQFFDFPQLSALSAPNNCFKGGFETISCDNTSSQLRFIDLDGLYSPCSCVQGYDLLKPVHYFGGPLPHCLFVPPRVLDVSLSGNGFSGTIPESFNVTTFSFSLNLSRNFLVGTLPNVFNKLIWSKLDLSYNKLSGVVPNLTMTEAKGRTSLILINNRFSFASVPFLLDMDRVDLSKGNLLKESSYRRRYPESFPVTESRLLIGFIRYYFIVGGVAILFAIIGWVFRLYEFSDSSDFIDSSSIRIFVPCLIVICLSLLLCYYYLIHLSQYRSGYKMYENTYDWSVSSLYLRGYLSGGIIATSFIILNLLFQFNYRIIIGNYIEIPHQTRGVRRLPSRVDYSLTIGFYLIVFCLNFILSLAVNQFYLKLQNTLINTNAGDTKLIQVIMVMYNIVWNRYVILWIFQYLQSLSEGVISEKRQFDCLLCLLLTSSVITPWISTLFTDESCFEGLISSRSEVHQLIGEAECKWWNHGADNRICHRRTSFSLPFLYFHLCSSQLLLTQIPLWIYYYSLMPIVHLYERFIREVFIRHRDSNRSIAMRSFIWKVDIVFDFTLLLCYGIHYPLLAFIMLFKVIVQYFMGGIQLKQDDVWVELSVDSTHSEIEMQSLGSDHSHHIRCREKQEAYGAILELLIRRGSRLNIINKLNLSPCESADRNGNIAVGTMLELAWLFQPTNELQLATQVYNKFSNETTGGYIFLDSRSIALTRLIDFINRAIRMTAESLSETAARVEVLLGQYCWDVKKLKRGYVTNADKVLRDSKLKQHPNAKK
eukprot:gene3217-3429_t